MSNSAFSDLDHHVESSRPRFEADLQLLVEIPTVSMDPAHKPDIQRGAEAAASVLRSCGATARVVPTEGNPVVVGELVSDPKHPWLTVYNHMDVQPADEPTWRSDPFKMQIDEDKYIGRGSTDDKGPGLTALYAARYAREHGVPLNVRFLWELEEEIGSPSFEGMVKAELPRLRTDSVLVSDTIWIAKGRPAVPYGLRGVQGFTIRLETGAKNTHSGLTGGPARNPVAEIAGLVAKMMDPDTGKVKIPGFYDDVRPLGKKEKASFAASGFNVARYKQAHELRSLRTDNAAEVMKRIWALPTFEIHGISGGYHGPGVKTVVPSWAEAKISCRLVPDMKAAKVLKLIRPFVKKHLPDAVLKEEHHLDWFLGEISGPHAEAATKALRFGFGRAPAFVREGGSIGAVVTMVEYLKCPLIMIGLSLPEHGYHAPNENYDWGQASGGMKTFVKYFAELSQIG
ncbi:MAG TPA: M20/M25/M40 family metallo-hydrolase [Candidatus Krumholzibacteria bacterium]|nr:M20/M25/M40 family metallo-hydrolase [Candidatus Krumholzibacteria bacterium]